MFARTRGFESHSPRLSWYLYDIIKSQKSKDSLRKTRLSEKQEYDLLIRKIDSITKSCTKAYFNKILKNLAIENFENASIICDYIIAEETEINIKNSTKESRIKVITWLSNFYKNI